MFLRVACKNDYKIGPHYHTSDYVRSWVGFDYEKPLNFTRPQNDKLLKDFWYFSYNENKMLFGFSNQNQFEQWFHEPKWKQNLDREGFVLYEFPIIGTEGIDYQLGKTQAIFTPNAEGPLYHRSLID